MRDEEKTKTQLIKELQLLRQENARLKSTPKEELQMRIRQQAAVARLGQYALAGNDLSTLFRQTVELIADTLQVEYCSILQLLPGGQALQLHTGIGCQKNPHAKNLIPAGHRSQAGYTLLSGQPVIVENWQTETRFSTDYLQNYNFTSGVSVIIHNREQPFGVLCMHTTQHRIFTQDDIHFFQAVANTLSTVILRQHATEALQQNEARLRSVVNNVVDGLITIDEQGIIETFNPAAEKIFGYLAAEVTGQNVKILMPDPYHSEHDTYLSNYLTTGQSKIIGSGREVTGRRKDGSLFPIDLAVSEFYLGERRMFIGIVRDITERAQLEEQIRQSQKMEAVGRLAGGIAHDFNNLLIIISGHSEFLLNHYDDPHDPRRQEAEQIKHAAERAASLIEQLLAFSRQQKLQPKVFNLNKVVTGVKHMLSRVIGEDIALTTHLAPDLGLIRADPGQLEQVIINLALNAKEAMPRGGELHIKTYNVDIDESATEQHFEARPGPFVALSITDTGHGIDTQTKAHIFEPFFSGGKGTGLGLSTVYGIVKQSGGYILVNSQPGRGTTFTIHLPRLGPKIHVDPQRSANKPAALPSTPPAQAAGTVLLVEDEAGVRFIIKKFLKKQGYTVLEAGTAQEALNVCRQRAVQLDLLITDVVMTNASGPELADRLEKIYPGLKVLYISGYADDALKQRGITASDITLLEKPFTSDTLAQKIHQVLNGKKQQA